MVYKKVYLASLWNKVVEELCVVELKNYKEFIGRFDVPVESVDHGRQVKPYVDADPVKTLDYTDADWDADILKNKQTILEKFSGANITINDIYIIKRKYQVDGGIKCSVHYTVDKIRMSSRNMLTLFKNIDIEGFDKSVYTKDSKNKFLTSVYTTKKIVDNKEKSLPAFLPDGNAHISKHLVSYIEEDFEDWDLKFAKIELKPDEITPVKKRSLIDEIIRASDGLKIKGDTIVKVDDEDDDDISEYDIETSKYYIKKICNDLDVKKQLDDYDDWIKVMFAIINVCKVKKISNKDCRQMLHDVSKKSYKYDEDKVEKWININIDKVELCDKGLGINYLINTCIKNDNYELWQKYYEKPSYKTIKNRFEKHCFKCLNNILFIDVNEKRDDIDEEVFFILKQKEVCEKYGHLTYFEKKCEKGVWKINEKQFIPKWIKDNHIKCYQSVCFCPKELDDIYSNKHFNLFKGFRASLLSPKFNYKIIKLFLNHIKEVLMNNDQNYYDWFIQYLANLVQNPNNKSNVIVVFQGTQGGGKSIIVDTIVSKIIGKDYAVSTSNPERVFFGNFNSLLCNKILSVINEAGNELRGCMDKIKDLSVVDSVNVEKKGKDPITFANYNNFIATTNNLNPFDIDWDDRRFAWFRISDKYVGNEEYFNKLAESIEHEDFASSLYNYLKYEVNITIKNFQKSRPITRDYIKVKLRNLPNPIKFLQNYNFDFRKARGSDNKIFSVSKSHFYDEYKSYCEKNKYSSYNECSFRAYFDKPNTGITLIKYHNYIHYRFEKELFDKFMYQFNNKDIDDIPEMEMIDEYDNDFIEDND